MDIKYELFEVTGEHLRGTYISVAGRILSIPRRPGCYPLESSKFHIHFNEGEHLLFVTDDNNKVQADAIDCRSWDASGSKYTPHAKNEFDFKKHYGCWHRSLEVTSGHADVGNTYKQLPIPASYLGGILFALWGPAFTDALLTADGEAHWMDGILPPNKSGRYMVEHWGARRHFLCPIDDNYTAPPCEA
jgi:hypothetical protein